MSFTRHIKLAVILLCLLYYLNRRFAVLLRISVRSIIGFVIWLEVFLDFKSYVPTWRMIFARLTSLIDSFTWSYMYCTFVELNGRTFRIYLWLFVFVVKIPFRLFTVLPPRMKTDVSFLLLLLSRLLSLSLFKLVLFFLFLCLHLSLLFLLLLLFLTLLLLPLLLLHSSL